jgi:FliI/YscN family ATPase
VVALVGERGREVGDFLRDSLGEAGRTRSVVVCATSDASAPERLSAVDVATSVAEAFRDDGAEVLLLVDSLTRVCRAAREIGLSAGEPPARRGYPPSAFSLLPRLVERAGTGERGGSITAFYTVLLEGGDLDEPVADEVRGLLDGHVVLDRSRAERGQFPAIDPVVSLSRLASKVAPPEVLQHAQAFRRLESLRLEKRDLIALGAYVPGTDLELERALRLSPHFAEFLAQPLEEASPVDVTDRRLEALFATR